MARAPHRPHAPGAESDDLGSFGGLADVLEPDDEAPARVQDFAFADTVYANEREDGPPPPSGPIFVHDPMGHTQGVTPLAFRLPAPAEDLDLRTRLRVLPGHARRAFHASVEEMRELWADTNERIEPAEAGAARDLRRIVALWSLFHWSRADVTHAAMMGLAVFLTAAAIGATTIDLGGGPSPANSDEVRARHTLDQHTGKPRVPRSKR